MFVVQNGLLFDYYPVKVGPHSLSIFLSIEVSPPVLTDGFICYQRKIYKVSANDLLRRRINVKNEQSVETTDTKREKAKSTNSRTDSVPDNRTQRADEFVEHEKSEDINLAFKNQIDSLLHAYSSKEGEEWEITGNS